MSYRVRNITSDFYFFNRDSYIFRKRLMFVPTADIDTAFAVRVHDAIEFLLEVLEVVIGDAVGRHPVLQQVGHRLVSDSLVHQILPDVFAEEVVDGFCDTFLSWYGDIVELAGWLCLTGRYADGKLIILLDDRNDVRRALLQIMTYHTVDVRLRGEPCRVTEVADAPLPPVGR
jgi:hypothetical protein